MNNRLVGSMERAGPIRCAVIGNGEWFWKAWFDELMEFVRSGKICLDLVDRCLACPERIIELRQTTAVEYHHHDQAFGSEVHKEWRVVFVLADAGSQANIIRRVINHCSRVERIVVEKPLGVKYQDVLEIISLARSAEIDMVMTDHYISKACCEFLFTTEGQAVLGSIGKLAEIEAVVKETRSGGPQSATVVTDMLIHVISPLVLLLPPGRFIWEEVDVRRAFGAPEWMQDSYCRSYGQYLSNEGEAIKITFEAGKMLAQDQKYIQITARDGVLTADFGRNELLVSYANGMEVSIKWKRHWSYARTLDRLLTLSQLETRGLGPTTYCEYGP